MEKIQNRFYLAAAWVVTITAITAGIAPNLLPALFLTFGFILIGANWGRGRDYWVDHLKNSPLIVLFLAFCVYLLINSFWAADVGAALGKTATVLVTIAICFAGSLTISQMPRLQLYRSIRGAVIGITISLLFVGMELVENQTVINQIAILFPGLISLQKDSGIAPEHFLNSNLSTLSLLLWPTLLMVSSLATKWLRISMITTLLILTIVATFLSKSATAELAIVLAAMSWLATRMAPGLLHYLMVVAWCGSVILVIPLTTYLFQAGLHQAPWLHNSAQERIRIWHFTDRKIADNPILGIGIRSSRAVAESNNKKNIDRSQGRPGWHPHNLFLQTWFELGAVGAVFLLFIGIMILRKIPRLPRMHRAYAYAGFTAFSTVGAFGHGMWQTWLIAAYAWTLILFMLGTSYHLSGDVSSRTPETNS